jgi:hypothetical protein
MGDEKSFLIGISIGAFGLSPISGLFQVNGTPIPGIPVSNRALVSPFGGQTGFLAGDTVGFEGIEHINS